MFVKLEASEMKLSSDLFVGVCRFIPNYGVVESILVSFVVEAPLQARPVYIDDVHLGPDPPGDRAEQCPVYIGSYPVRRHAERNFLQASPLVEAPSSLITIATQLTIDRLSNLQRLVWNDGGNFFFFFFFSCSCSFPFLTCLWWSPPCSCSFLVSLWLVFASSQFVALPEFAG